MSRPVQPLQLQDDLPGNPWIVAFTVMLATFMEVLDTSIANVALPHIAGNLSASVDESTWVLTSYLVSNAIVLPLAGWFSMLFGRKRFYIACVILFTGSSLLCGLSSNIEWLVFFRILQGAGGGALQPLSQSILIESFPVQKRGMAMAMYGMGVVAAPIIGPTLGGWLTDNYSWRWIFLINIPVGLLSIFLSGLLVKDSPHQVRKTFKQGLRIDAVGLGLIALGLGTLQIVLDRGERLDWFNSSYIWTLSIICVVSILIAVVWEWFHEEPVVDLRLFKEINFSSAAFLMYALGFVLYGSTMLLPMFLQTLMGYTALSSGLVMSPGGFLTMASMPLIGILMTRVQPRLLVIIGLLIGALGLWRMAEFTLDISFSNAMWARNLMSAALGFLFVPINSVAYAYVPKEKYDKASGLLNLARNLGGSFGISLMTTFLSRHAQMHQTNLVSHINPYDPKISQALQTATATLHAQGQDLATASVQAHGLMYSTVVKQSMLLAFLDDFRLMAFIFLALIPLLFLIRKTPRQQGSAPMH